MDMTFSRRKRAPLTGTEIFDIKERKKGRVKVPEVELEHVAPINEKTEKGKPTPQNSTDSA